MDKTTSTGLKGVAAGSHMMGTIRSVLYGLVLKFLKVFSREDVRIVHTRLWHAPSAQVKPPTPLPPPLFVYAIYRQSCTVASTAGKVRANQNVQGIINDLVALEPNDADGESVSDGAGTTGKAYTVGGNGEQSIYIRTYSCRKRRCMDLFFSELTRNNDLR